MTNRKYKNNQKAIVIGGSAGSIPVLNKILGGLTESFSIPIIICIHRMKNVAEGMSEVFSSKSSIHISEPNDKDEIRPYHAYLAPSNYHLLIEKGRSFSLSTDIMINYSRPSIDLTLESAAVAYQTNLTGILLTGANKDGAKGLKAIRTHGGTTIVQDPLECAAPTMPLAALELKCVDFVMNTDQIISYLRNLNK